MLWIVFGVGLTLLVCALLGWLDEPLDQPTTAVSPTEDLSTEE